MPMGMTTVLYGHIYAPGEAAEMNAASIAALPEDDPWPYLTHDLFSLPHMHHSYNDQLISFGTLYKNLEPGASWDRWQAKFEALLRTMVWDVAHVYLDVESEGRYHFTWKRDEWQWSVYETPKAAMDAFGEMTVRPVERWTFSGGRTGEAEF
jgi:hypothetical protein